MRTDVADRMRITDTKRRSSAKIVPKRMHSVKIDELIKPTITIRQLDAQGREISRQVAHNSLTFAAADIFTNALLKSAPSQITHLYARFGDSGANPGYLAPEDSDIRTTTRSTFITSTDVIRGGLWVPVLSAPVQDSSDGEVYLGNRSTFFFRIPYNIEVTQTSPQTNFNVESSYIYALGLAVAFNSGDRAQDKIFSAMQAYGYNPEDEALGNFTVFQIPNGGQTAIDYTIPIKFKEA